MKKYLGMTLLIGCGVALFVLGCNQQQNTTFDETTMKTIIKEKNDRFTQAHITRDTTFLNNIFAQGAKVFPPNSDVVTGRAAIAAGNAQWVSYDIKEFTEETTALYGSGDYVIDEGTYYLRYGKDNTIDKGKYLNVWKKEDGDWKMFSNMWNTSIPETPAK